MNNKEHKKEIGKYSVKCLPFCFGEKHQLPFGPICNTPGGATYRINPDHDITIVEKTREKLVKLLKLKPFLFFAMNDLFFWQQNYFFWTGYM